MDDFKIGDKVYCDNLGKDCTGRVININNEEIIVKLDNPIRRIIGRECTFKKI